MASSVLGKRTRSSTDIAPLSSRLRAKRQATTTVYDDESMDLDELDDTTVNVKVKNTPTKKASRISRPVASPSNIKSRPRSAEEFVDENECSLQLRTPQSTRHRDVLSKKVPITPRHRVAFVGKTLTPSTPRTPSTPGSSFTSVYQAARQLFTRSVDPGRLVGREEERKELTDLINACIENTSGACTYISGPPGTGKSALVNEVTSSLAESATIKKAYVNCMSMKTSKDLYTTLLDDLCQDDEVLEGEEIQKLQSIFAPKKQSNMIYVVTLDEIDHILTLDLEFMYKLFEWSLEKSSHLVLIGIANALDLTDRFLPRLKARNLRPQLLPVMPYNATQIKAVILTRLKSLLPSGAANPEYIPFLHPAAIELCSRKVSSQTGDLRKAFDICRRAIELIESETKEKHQQAILEEQQQSSPSKKPLGENINLSSPAKPSTTKAPANLTQSFTRLTAETAPRASIAHVNKITASTIGNGTSQRLKTLNLQQKAALCALFALEKRKRIALSNVMATPSKSNIAAPTVKALYDTYCMLCRRDSVLHPLTSTEFRDVIGSLETLSLISAVDGKSGSFVGLNTPSKRGRKGGFGSGVGTGDEKRVGSCVGERELNQAAEGLGAAILKSILSGEGLD